MKEVRGEGSLIRHQRQSDLGTGVAQRFSQSEGGVFFSGGEGVA